MKKGALFDMDGLMFDTERLFRESWDVLIESYGVERDPAFPSAVCGTSGEGMRQVIRRYYPQVDPDRYIRDCYARVGRITQEQVPVKEGLMQILELLSSRGVRLAVASSSPQETILHHIRNAGVERYFNAVVSGAGLPHGKPAPDIFLKAAEELSLPPQDCYVLEDGFNGVRAGHAAGCTTIMIPDQTPPDEEMKETADAIYESLSEAAGAMERGEI